MNEQEKVLASFLDAFEETKDCPRALYGIGINTKYILEHIEGYEILALMDQSNEGEIFFDLPVRSPEEVKGQVKEIVIITRFINLNVVYQRIKHLEEEGIVIKGPDGSVLSEIFSVENRDFSDFPYPKEEIFLEKIQGASVVSFDMFDTLVQRSVLEPEDIFALVEKKSGFVEFSCERIKAQKESLETLGEGRSFSQIYQVFQKNTGCTDEKRDELQKMELDTEFEYMMPRVSGVSAFQQCLEDGKQVFILSDMYLSGEILEKLLGHCGISGYTECIVSCDYGMTKQSGELFGVLKEKAKGKALVHIGDNLKADVLSAEEQGISAFHFMSYTQLLANSPFMDMLQKASSLADRLLLGDVFSHLLDSPFALTKYSGRLCLDGVDILAKTVVTPLVLRFLAWQAEVLEKERNPRIFYMARDGYLLHDIYEELRQMADYQHLPPSEYVLASRRGLILPNISTEEDILDLLAIDTVNDFEGVDRLIQERFAVEVCYPSHYPSMPPEEKKAWIMSALLSKKEEIFQNAQREKREYLRYLEQFDVKEDETIFVFDLATKGTVWSQFNKITENAHKGICFAWMNSLAPHEDMQSMFGQTMFYGAQKYFFFSSFMTIEAIFDSDDGQFLGLREGVPVFRNEPNKSPFFGELRESTKKQVFLLLEKEPLSFWNDCNLALIDLLYGCFRKEYSVVSKELQGLFIYEDAFAAKSENLFDLVGMEFLP